MATNLGVLAGALSELYTAPSVVFFGIILARGRFLVVAGGVHVFTPSEGPAGPETTVPQILSPHPWKLILSY